LVAAASIGQRLQGEDRHAAFTDLHSTLEIRNDLALDGRDLWSVRADVLTKCSRNCNVQSAVHRLATIVEGDFATELGRELSERTDEKGQMLAIVAKLLFLLTTKPVTLNIREYPQSMVKPPSKREHLGIGTSHTWHGSPDCRCDIDIVNLDADEGDMVSDFSAGTKTSVEMKRSALTVLHLNQIIGNVVTYIMNSSTIIGTEAITR
jgi:hypothetical protein